MLAMECMASTKYMRAEVLLTLTNVKYYSACYDKSSDIPCHPPKPSRLEQIIIKLPPTSLLFVHNQDMTAVPMRFFTISCSGTNPYTVLASLGNVTCLLKENP